MTLCAAYLRRERTIISLELPELFLFIYFLNYRKKKIIRVSIHL